MRIKLFLSAFILALLTACGGGETSNNADLDLLVAERDSLVEIYQATGKKIGELEKSIMELDTNNGKKLTAVTVHPVSRKTFKHYFEVQGTLEAPKNSLVFAEMPGNVSSIAVKEGQKVSGGQTILRLDANVIRKSIDEVKTSYELANTVYEKRAKLWEQKIGSEIEYLQAKNNKEMLESKLATLQEQLNQSVVTAPFAGTVDDILPKLGEQVSPGMPVARVLNLSEIHAEADVSERYIGRIHKGDEVQVMFSDMDTTLVAKIRRIGDHINPNNRTFRITVDLENKNELFKPNQVCVLKINDYMRDSAVAVPSNMILEDIEGNSFVYVAEGNDTERQAKKVMVKTGLSYSDETMIEAGLSGMEELVNKGARSIKDGQEINVVRSAN